MKAFLLYLLLAHLVLTAQATLLKGGQPDLILVIVCLYSLRYGQAKGIVYGAVTGLILDTISGFLLGPHMLGKSMAGMFMGTVREHLFQWNIFVNTIVVTFLAVINIVVVYLVLETFSPLSFVNRPFEISLIEVIYTAIAAMLFYPVLKPVQEWTG